MSSDKFNYILYADDTTLNATVESFGETAADIQLSISNELQKICKWLDLNKLHINVAKSKFMLFHMPQKVIPQLHISLNGSAIDYVTELIFFRINCNLNFKSHLKTIDPNIYIRKWGSNCHSVELLQKKALRVVNFKSPVAHTEPILKNMNQLKLPDLYTFHLLKLYYKLYRNNLPPYFENFIPQYGAYHQNLRNNLTYFILFPVNITHS